MNPSKFYRLKFFILIAILFCQTGFAQAQTVTFGLLLSLHNKTTSADSVFAEAEFIQSLGQDSTGKIGTASYLLNKGELNEALLLVTDPILDQSDTFKEIAYQSSDTEGITSLQNQILSAGFDLIVSRGLEGMDSYMYSKINTFVWVNKANNGKNIIKIFRTTN